MASVLSVVAAVSAVLALAVPAVHFVVDTAFRLFGG